MKLFAPPITVSLTEGFTADNDLFGRAPYGRALYQIIKAQDGPLVVALDAPWGEGKTTFARMWAGYIQQQGGRCIYFDAYENDYQVDPFVALASQIFELLEGKDQNRKKEFVSIAKKAGRIATRIGVKALTGLTLDGSVVDDADVLDDIAEEGSEAIDRVLERRITGAEDDRKTLDAFRQFLEQYAQESDFEGPLVFLIDELDRCKPDYALALVEMVKHLFSVESVVFVLVVNRSQLEESIRARYGAGIDAKKYLQKYVSIWASLPDVPSGSESHRARFLSYCVRSMQCGRTKRLLGNSYRPMVALADHFGSSLRELERVLTNFAIVANATEGNMDENHVDLAVVVSFLKVVHPSLYAKLRVGTCTYAELAKETDLELLKDPKWYGKPEGNYVALLLKYYLSEEDERSKILEHNKDIFKSELRNPEDAIPMVCMWLDAFSR